jgi:hypothetical protein
MEVSLGGFVVAGPALAASPLPMNAAASLVIPVQDEENAEVWHDLRPGVTPPEAAVGKQEEEEVPKEAAPERPKEEGSGGNVENEEVWHDLRTGETPPPAAVGN